MKIYSAHLHEWDKNIVLMVIFIEVKYSGIEKSAWCYCGDVIKRFFLLLVFPVYFPWKWYLEKGML